MSCSEYCRFIGQNGLDFIERNEYTFFNFHVEPLEALRFRGYQEDARFELPVHEQYALVQLYFNKEELNLDTAKASVFMRLGEDETSIALHACALQTFTAGENELNSAWTFRTKEGLRPMRSNRL